MASAAADRSGHVRRASLVHGMLQVTLAISKSSQFPPAEHLCPAQFLESYKSVTLGSMAAAFGVSVDFMDRELVDFIVAGRLPAKIDKARARAHPVNLEVFELLASVSL